jgi:DNA-binding MarR family transcriptional regulator
MNYEAMIAQLDLPEQQKRVLMAIHRDENRRLTEIEARLTAGGL